MIKKVIICLLVFAFLSSVIAPKSAFAGTSPEMSTGTVLAITAACLVVIFGALYLEKKAKTEWNEKEADLIINTIKKNVSPSG